MDFAAFRAQCAAIAGAGDLSTFRQEREIRTIVDNVPEAVGEMYAAAAQRIFGDAWTRLASRIAEIDRVGSPPQPLDLGEWGADVALSPEFVRYAFRALELDAFLGLRGRRVVEIGGGYGGLAAVADRLVGSIFSWTIVDIAEASALQARYLSDVMAYSVSTDAAAQRYAIDAAPVDLVVSDYALSEVGESEMEGYVPLLRRASVGAVIWNEGGGMSTEDGAAWLREATGRILFRLGDPHATVLGLEGLEGEHLAGRMYWGSGREAS